MGSKGAWERSKVLSYKNKLLQFTFSKDNPEVVSVVSKKMKSLQTVESIISGTFNYNFLKCLCSCLKDEDLDGKKQVLLLGTK